MLSARKLQTDVEPADGGACTVVQLRWKKG